MSNIDRKNVSHVYGKCIAKVYNLYVRVDNVF